jgi:transcriptional regulator with XRE-family HTH domain
MASERTDRSVARQVGRVVALLRKRAGLSQEALAEKVGVAPDTISRLERGRHVPPLEGLSEIAIALGVGLRDLFPPSDASAPMEEIHALLAPRTAAEIRLAGDLARRAFDHIDASRDRRGPGRRRR